VLGPLGLEQYQQLLPQAALFQTLVDWVRNYLGIEYAWDYVLVLRRQEVPAARLGSSTQLGWTTWLTHAEPAQDARDFRLDPEAWLRQRRWQSLSFGAATYAALLVPGLNLLIMPAAVAGATLFWVQEGGPARQLDRQGPRSGTTPPSAP